MNAEHPFAQAIASIVMTIPHWRSLPALAGNKLFAQIVIT